MEVYLVFVCEPALQYEGKLVTVVSRALPLKYFKLNYFNRDSQYSLLVQYCIRFILLTGLNWNYNISCYRGRILLIYIYR
jgi:hypothetical protein